MRDKYEYFPSSGEEPIKFKTINELAEHLQIEPHIVRAIIDFHENRTKCPKKVHKCNRELYENTIIKEIKRVLPK